MPTQHVPKCSPPQARSQSEWQQDESYMTYPSSIGDPEYAPSERSRGASSIRLQSPTGSGVAQQSIIATQVPSPQEGVLVDTLNGVNLQIPPPDNVETPAQAYARSHSSRWRASQSCDGFDHPPHNNAGGHDVVETHAIPALIDDDRPPSHDPTSQPPLSRHPPSHPALSPEYRYCRKDEIIKPPRTHHSRISGTV